MVLLKTKCTIISYTSNITISSTTYYLVKLLVQLLAALLTTTTSKKTATNSQSSTSSMLIITINIPSPPIINTLLIPSLKLPVVITASGRGGGNFEVII